VTGSTNADLLLRANQGAPEGLWLRADSQNAGRGRMGRHWVSPAGNLCASSIIRLKYSDPAASSLAFVAAVAVHKSLSKLSPFSVAQIKWPNDLLSMTGDKLCGILLERANDAVVVGIGVNLAYRPEGTGRPVTCIAMLGLPPPAPQEFAEILAQDFAETLLQWRTYGPAVIFADWKDRAHPVGTALNVQLPDGAVFCGIYDGITEEGALMLRLADGDIRVIHAADVFLV
jgi:BirA family transcriptional regulator, biotin operon repressor / biotin---[acetyl-CoA-carboxylase] ligase